MICRRVSKVTLEVQGFVFLCVLCEKLSYLLAYQNLSQGRKARKEEKSSPANSELETLVHRRRCLSFRIEERRLHYARAHAMAH